MRTKTGFVPALFLFLLGCQHANNERSADMAMIESSNADTTGIASADVDKREEPARRFIRTADLKFKVKTVGQSTAAVEEITKRQGGFITYTNLSSNIEEVTAIPVSEDSSLETTTFKVANSMILRVPDTRLDTTLQEISKIVDYLDYRVIKADDVSLQMLSNELTTKRAHLHGNRLTRSIDTRTSKLGETVAAEESVYDKQRQADDAKISNMLLTDQVRYSTISLKIYQRQTFKKEIIANNRPVTAYEPSFGSKLLEAVQDGWQVLQTLVLIIAKLWSVLLAAMLLFFGYRSYKRVLVK